jgi:hypothetical protein
MLESLPFGVISLWEERASAMLAMALALSKIVLEIYFSMETI